MSFALLGRAARGRSSLVVGLALLAFASCGEPTESRVADLGVTLELTLEPAVPVVGASQVTLRLSDAGGEPVERAEVRIEGNMNHAGMVPVFADASETTPGRYVAQIEFTMGGDWFLLVEARTPDGRSWSWQRDVPGVRHD